MLDVVSGVTVKVTGEPCHWDVLSTAGGSKSNPTSYCSQSSSPFQGAGETSSSQVPKGNEIALALDSKSHMSGRGDACPGGMCTKRRVRSVQSRVIQSGPRLETIQTPISGSREKRL